jgi:trehalose 6-phosphate phosphatase
MKTKRGSELPRLKPQEAARGFMPPKPRTGQTSSSCSLRRSDGRASIELYPPIEFSKATVVRDRVKERDLQAAMFIGDDTVDLPAFDALDELAARGMTTVRVGVVSDEAPDELLERADIKVDGPAGVLGLLEELGER